MAKPPSTDHLDAAKRRLVHLSGLSARTADAERRILTAAQDRHAAVLADMDRLRPRVNTDPKAADAYQDLVLEAGQLARVISQANKVLGT
ncbi:MAG TPA: hypothetical protein VGC15_20450 [Acetobacteraceae bacterium]